MTSNPVFTPSAAPPGRLDAATVGRTELFTRLVRRIVTAAEDGSRPHTLLVAPRGGGKTHTLQVAIHRAVATVPDRVLSLELPEDSLAIGCYTDLLVELLRSQGPDTAERARAWRRAGSVIDLEREIADLADGRMILLAIENLDRVFAALGRPGQGSFRAWVETSAAVLVFATAPALFSGVSSRTFPWYGSFIVEHLPELTVSEGAEMLARAATERGDTALAAFVRSPEGQDRLQVIHRLAGGSPRLWHIVSDSVDVAGLDELVPAVEALLDRLSPYYQQQLWLLPAGEQRLVVELARSWEPRTVTELAAAVGVSNQSASAALGRLAADRWVVSTKSDSGDRRASWYDLAEPLLRYYLQYRENRGEPLRLIVEFLRSFYSRRQLIAELADADADSPLERHLQRALADSQHFWAPPEHDPDLTFLLGLLRVWLADDGGDLTRVAAALEPVVSGVAGRSCDRRLADDLQPVVTRAVAAADDASGPPGRRLQSGIDVLAGEFTDGAAADALLWVDLLWGDGDDREKTAKLAASSAVRHRRTTPYAVNHRALLAIALMSGGDPVRARAVLEALLDDIAENPSSLSLAATVWNIWARAVVAAPDSAAPRGAEPLVAATGITTALTAGHVAWSQLPTVLGAIRPDDRRRVAAQLELIRRTTAVPAPDEYRPLDYVGDDVRPALDRLTTDA